MARNTEDVTATEQMTTRPYLTLEDTTIAVPDVSVDEDTETTTDVVTIVGTGEPLSYEVAAHGTVEMVNANPKEEGVIVSEGVAEGALSTGFVQFAVHGDLGDVTFLAGDGKAYFGDEQIDALSQ